MSIERTDKALLWDMLEAARAVRDFVEGLDQDDYVRDLKTQAAVERKIEIIGEAARRVSAGLKQRTSQIPWKGIVSQRHVLAHEYGEIQQSRIWRVTSQSIPELIEKLEELMSGPPTGNSDNSTQEEVSGDDNL
jgi:uncharacterized protein with HEPN domain